jgi:alpha-ketoglutarate-dependent taurine dioxygenase
VTGEKALYLSPTSTWSVVGFLTAESAHLLDFLHRHIEALDLTCRVRWAPGTVVVWDQVRRRAIGPWSRLLLS